MKMNDAFWIEETKAGEIPSVPRVDATAFA
jgi:hypothetical protein